MCAKKLTIVSDTAIFYAENHYFAFGPVVREIEFIEHLFDQITWIGYDRQDRIGDLSMQKIQSPKIKVILFKSVGGKGVFSFLRILIHYPYMFFVIFKQIQKSDIIHTRAPSHPALIAILLSFFVFLSDKTKETRFQLKVKSGIEFLYGRQIFRFGVILSFAL